MSRLPLALLLLCPHLPAADWPIRAQTPDGRTLEAIQLNANVTHVRLRGAEFREALLERYGVVKTDWPAWSGRPRAALEIADGGRSMKWGDRELRPTLEPLTREQVESLVAPFRAGTGAKVGGILGDPGENRKAGSDDAGVAAGRPFGFTLQLKPGERLYGLGTASKEHIQLRGHSFYNWVRYQDTEQPVPFLMSTAGWAIFVNTTWGHYVDVGKTNASELRVWGPDGELDFFLIAGGSMAELLDHYTQIAGRPALLPQWAYGLTFINHINADQHEVYSNARTFRQMGIPVDGFGLEPGWMKKNYDFSTKKEWNDARFFIPPWLKADFGANQNFLASLRRRGFKVHLWLCSDYDLSDAEERDAAARSGRAYSTQLEPWFDHLKKFIDDGVAGWKLDPARYVDKADLARKYTNARPESEMHNLNSVLWPKQIAEGHRAHAKRRPMLQYCGGWAGTQRYSAQTVGDIMMGPDGLAWMLGAGMSGLSNTSGDMWVNRPSNATGFWPDGAGVHFGFLAPWTLIDGWAYSEEPWWSTEKIEAMVKDYAQLRYRLMPYIYSTAHQAHRTGMPMLRAMPLMFPDDEALADNVTQYMFGDSLLVTAFTPKVRLPAGEWFDYWTGKRYKGPAEIEYAIPENRGGGLFVRAGAIIPMQADMQYVGQRPVEEIALHVWPGPASSFTLYEDDGVSLAHQSGAVAVTRIDAKRKGASMDVTVGAREGSYDGMPANRKYNVVVHGGAAAGTKGRR